MDKNIQTISPGLYLVSTPIGNMEDITFRALNVLKKSDIILCEDTRRSGRLLSYFKIKKKLLSYHKFNEEKISNKVMDFLKDNKVISLISDAGTPTISDPGIVLINKCIDDKIKIFPIPGPSSVTSAVSVSGFSDKYIFYGFLKKKEKELERVFKDLSQFNYTIVFFIPSPKIDFYLNEFKKYFADRKILIAKEMTKIHEDYIRESVQSIISLPAKLKGELTVVLSEKIGQKNIKKEMHESVKMEILNMLRKYTVKDVVEYITKKENLPKKLVYNYCLKIKK